MRSYFIIASPSSGGAEKRFFDILMKMRSDGSNVMMIAPSLLVKQFIATYPHKQEAEKAFISIEMKKWSRLYFVYRLFKLLRSLPFKSVFHYPMNCLWPLHFGRRDKLSMSVTHCNMRPGPFTNSFILFWIWLSFFFVSRIDILSPNIFSAMKNYRTANKMSLTPQGTFVLTPPTIQRSRAPTVAFLSRLVSQKGIDDFLDILPDVWRALKDRIPKGFKFIIGGYGPLQGHVANRVDKLNAVGVPIDFIGYTNATELFACTSVVLSMQEITNYPSRVVAEALMSGCAVIVRNTGDSMHFGNNIPGLFYCEGHLKSTELAEKIERLVGFIINDSKYSITIRASAIQKFGSEECINYFKRILSCRQFTHFRYRC